MSMAARCWWGSSSASARVVFAASLVVLLLGPAVCTAHAAGTIDSANQKKAQQVLDATIQALGGQAWLNLRTMRSKGKTAAFFQGNPTGVVAVTTETTALPDQQRIDFAPKGRVVQIYTAHQGWEITYKGKKDLTPRQMETYRRWRDHSLGVALRRWYADPTTILIDDGQTLVERRLADKVTLIDRNNDAITLEVDTETHLPRRLSFTWRDPKFHDKNLDAVEYDNYQLVDGIATPFTTTRTHNGETVRQRYVLRMDYNIVLRKGLFNPDLAAEHLR